MRSPSLLRKCHLYVISGDYLASVTKSKHGNKVCKAPLSLVWGARFFITPLPSSATSLSWEAEPCWDDSVHEILGLCLPSGLEGLGELPSKAFPKSTQLLLSSLDIYKQGTTRVSVCLLVSNDQNKGISLKSNLPDRSTYGHLGAHPKDNLKQSDKAVISSQFRWPQGTWLWESLSDLGHTNNEST